MHRLFAVCGLVAGVAITSTTPAAEEDMTVGEAVLASKDHTILAAAMKEAGLADTLKSKGPFTLFAPTDAAFRKLGDDKIRGVVADKALLKRILLAHVITGKALHAKDVAAYDGKGINGFPVSTIGDVTIGPAKVTKPDVKCGNGVIHVIDAVLIPTK